jgi:hypothetical protein
MDFLGAFQVAEGLKAIVHLPKVERQHYRQTMDEIYRLIDTTLNMVIIRLGDMLSLEDDQKFLDEASRLDNYSDWMRAEREFRLCKSLRIALSEAKTLQSKLSGKLSTEDCDALLTHMHSVLAREEEVAAYIGDRFQALAESARSAQPHAQTDTVRKHIAAVREALCQEHEQLIGQEIALYTIV